MSFRTRTFPSKFTFIDGNGHESIFVPEHHAGRIAALASALREKVQSTPQDPPIVGILFRTSPNLLLMWLACLQAGLRPLVMQYPTRKQSQAYWLASVQNTIETVSLKLIVADAYCAAVLGSACSIPVVSEICLDCSGVEGVGDFPPQMFDIVQLSSGTTGYRKAIQFSSAQLARHVADFNVSLRLRPDDVIVSWLPLYHDMGYVACFVMPLLLGIDVVMLDPITWVGQPDMLFDAIERHAGTVCYMPNFGFEVMARSSPRPMPTMRRWISCSEPVSAMTSDKFIAAIGAAPESFSPCYAMAENIFAISLADKCRIEEIDGTETVSCGRPIHGVDVKIVDGEIYVRSETSLVAYIGGQDIRDAEGYYPTGDLGELINGELFVSGRKQDLLIQAGRKYFLSDIDLRLNEMFPDIQGRAVALALRDDRIGTETPLLLIESQDFYDRDDGPRIGVALTEATGLDQVDVAFVPPRFLTKTSSGKFNRSKSRADWLAVKAAARRSDNSARDAAAELRASFPSADWDAPVKAVLDSLSQTILQIVLESTELSFDPGRSLREIESALRMPAKAVPDEFGIRIVSLADRLTVDEFNEPQIGRLEEVLGCRVTWEHHCLPPSPIVLSDLIFKDYFQPRLDPEPFRAVNSVLESLKNASLIIADDRAELAFLYESTYPVLSHNLERDPRSDLISTRWQQYVNNHHKLPVSVVGGIDIPLTASNESLLALGRYLRTPVFRVATIPTFEPFTEHWEHCARGTVGAIDPDAFTAAILAWIAELSQPLRPVLLRRGPRLRVSDLPHFCSQMANRDAVDMIAQHFDSFIIAGQASSVPYLVQQLERLGKRYVQVVSHAPDVLGTLTATYDCLVLCGPMGDFKPDIPTIALQSAGPSWRTLNFGTLADGMPRVNTMPKSGTDWYFRGYYERGRDREAWVQGRAALAEQRRKRGTAPAA